jgi:hypothetical protein
MMADGGKRDSHGFFFFRALTLDQASNEVRVQDIVALCIQVGRREKEGREGRRRGMEGRRHREGERR